MKEEIVGAYKEKIENSGSKKIASKFWWRVGYYIIVVGYCTPKIS